MNQRAKTMTVASTPKLELHSRAPARTGTRLVSKSSRDSRGQAVGLQDWDSIAQSLDAHGNAVLPELLTAAQCEQLAGMYGRADGYRARIVMARHGFGKGEYKYFAYPLPPLLNELRHALYPNLALIANRWNRQLGGDMNYPATLGEFLERCHRAGQTRPTPLILEYGEGDDNCLHQDL